jgi:glycosyltransferase involved in cell wall biosynthesis
MGNKRRQVPAASQRCMRSSRTKDSCVLVMVVDRFQSTLVGMHGERIFRFRPPLLAKGRRIMITGVVLARNEERNIVECLQSLRPHVAEILLIDMESGDRTVELARTFGARILHHPLVPCFDAARNIAAPEATHEWLWFVDADERVSSQIGELINRLIRSDGHQFEAITIPFKTFFCGKWIQHCGWWPGYTMPRVLKKGCFRFADRLHGGVDVKGRSILLPGDPQLAMEHFSYRSIEHYVEKLNQYTTTESLQLVNDGVKWDWKSAINDMMLDLWRYYEENPGRLDGEHGWILTWLSGQYRWLSHAKLLDRQNNHGEVAQSPSVPSNLDELIRAMEAGLAQARLRRPQLPLGIVWRSPIRDPSGYADEGRTFVKALSRGQRSLVLEEIRVAAQECGIPPDERALFRALSSVQRPSHVATISDAIPISVRPDPAACLNILRTTFETDRIPDYWLPLLEPFDEIWVISEHNRQAFRRSGVPPEKIRVVPSCTDTDRYCPQGERVALPEALRGRFVFLSVFDWALRKGWDLLLRAYCGEFQSSERTALLLKITRSHGHSMEIVREQANQVLAEFNCSLAARPDIFITDEPLTETQIACLYRSASAFVLPSRGEGWGRPYMEAMASGLPTIGTGASGNVDFMDSTNSFLIPATTVDVPEVATREIAVYTGHRWYEPDVQELRCAMRKVFGDEQERTRIALKSIDDIRRRFDLASGSAAIERALSAAEQRLAVAVAPEVKSGQIRVELAGEIFARHSFANVNEQLALKFIETQHVALSIRRSHGFPTYDRESFNRPRLLPYVDRGFDGRPDVTIRHAYPPVWEAPQRGRWVHIQPWEFGPLPKDWIEPLRDRVDEIWLPSKYLQKVYFESGIPQEKMHVIPWGIDPEVLHPHAPPLILPAKGFRFLFVGGTIHRKGIDLVLAAYLSEFRPDEDVSLVVKDMGTSSFYADSHHRDQLLQAASDSSNPHILYSEKYLTDGQMASLYTACNCLVAPYRGEGFGLPILEAMACGVVPIIPRGGPSDDYATESAAIFLQSRVVEDIVKEELSGKPTYLEVDALDLRKAMRRAFDDRAALNRMGESASAHIHRNYSWSKTVAAMTSRIEALVAPSRSLAQATSGPEEAGQPTAQSLFLIAYLVVGNDEAVLPDCLASVAPFVDEIIVTPSSSFDRSVAAAQEYGAIVETTWADAWDRALDDGGCLADGAETWLLILKPDEILREDQVQSMKLLIESLPANTAAAQLKLEKSHSRQSAHTGPDETIRLLRCEVGIRPKDISERSILDWANRTGMKILATQGELPAECRPTTDVIPSRPVPQSSKPALVTFATGEHSRFLEISLPLMKKYAARHGYDLINGDGSSGGRPPPWGKILFLRDVLTTHGAALWMDADTVIVDGSRDIREEISQQAMMAMVRHQTVDGDVPNTGVWYATRSALKFLEEVWAQEQFVDDPWWEQAAVMHLMGYDVTRPARLERATDYFYSTEWLSVRWNSHPAHESPSPYIKHATTGSIAQRIERMANDARPSRGSNGLGVADQSNANGEVHRTSRNRKVITLTASHRPQYLRQVLDALARCDGVTDYLLLASLEPGNDEVREIIEQVSFLEIQAVVNARRLGCAPNTFYALRRGFERCNYVIHLEDDTVPAKDALRFFEYCRDAYRNDKQVFTIGGYSACPDSPNISPDSLRGRHRTLTRHKWFNPWGWATWRDRFIEMAQQWNFHSWDTHLNEVVRANRYEVTPVLSRFQNIGAEQGAHVPSPEWHRLNQHLDFWAGMIDIPLEAAWSEPLAGGEPILRN